MEPITDGLLLGNVFLFLLQRPINKIIYKLIISKIPLFIRDLLALIRFLEF